MLAKWISMKLVSQKLDWIQALRGIAVVFVVLSHARYFLLNTPDWGMVDIWLGPGAMGVDLFFIISGFIMVYTTQKSDGSIASSIDFSIKRFARIWPVYAIATILYVMLVKDGMAYFAGPGHVAVFLKSLLLIPPIPSDVPFFGFTLPLAWTLAFEVYFYAVFCISMLFGRLRWVALCVWMLATVIAIPLIEQNTAFHVRTNFNFRFSYLNLITNSIIIDFMAGVAIAHIYLAPRIRLTNRILCLNLMWVSIGFALWCNFATEANFHGPTKWGWPLALMVLCIALASKTVSLAPPRFIVWLGTISYSVYLFHILVQFVLSRWLDVHGVPTNPWARVYITTLFSVPVAALSHHYLEVKLGGATRDLLTRMATRFLKPAAVVELEPVASPQPVVLRRRG
ncbi:acyltransferase family protein [Massilia pseudoviolaceinigra]|uniref:acyltransferase family protein n=1 Tax=Massilia pseudoviolaceinigra TaxID=3057165 RepID=UPI002796DBB3|nr:acyltransferase [Massilia sp. CCM 9206]MDQ1925035.1 acyltransferase [Massilia sp. CCM 9206]